MITNLNDQKQTCVFIEESMMVPRKMNCLYTGTRENYHLLADTGRSLNSHLIINFIIVSCVREKIHMHISNFNCRKNNESTGDKYGDG
jgi:hypothetical protein